MIIHGQDATVQCELSSVIKDHIIEKPAPEGETSGPQRNLEQNGLVRDRSEQRLDRMEHIMGRMMDAEIQEIGRRKCANRARKLREKQRRKKAASEKGT
jgi:uncharacterized protein YcbK (DUF882 family)